MTLSMLLIAIALALAAGEPAAPASAAPADGVAEPLVDRYSENSCVQCHRDLPGRSSEIVDLEWKHSVHYAADVGCDGCHGGNPSVKRSQFSSEEELKRAAHLDRNPEFLLINRDAGFVSSARGRSVSYFCGKCHSRIKSEHLGSPHGEFGDPTCLYCHGQGSHRITSPTPQIIDTRSRAEGGRCSACHRSGTMESVARIGTLLVDTEEQIKTSGDLYAELEGWGYRSLELEKLHHHAKEVRSQLRQVFHSFNMREISNFAAEINMSVERTRDTHELVQQLRETQRRQMVVGSIAVTVLLALAGLMVYYKRSFLDHSERVAAVPKIGKHTRGGF
jgi:hypothetical protein